jgi:hypothetical protein
MKPECPARQRGGYLRKGEGDWLSLLLALAAAGWRDGRIAAELTRRLGRRVSRHQVLYRRRLDAGEPLSLCRAARHALYQARHGWLFLLPSYLGPGRGWGPGHALRPREVDILCLLRDRGPQTARQLAFALGLSQNRPLVSGHHSFLVGLCRSGLVGAQGGPPRPFVYDLTEAAHDVAGVRNFHRTDKVARGN